MTTQEELIRNVLIEIGENPNREGLKDTPKRVVKSWKEIYSGYNEDPDKILSTAFSEDLMNYDQMIFCNDIGFWSVCEHHMLPFFGQAHVAYIPNKKVVGISKIVRLVECFSKRLQIQERLTTQIAQTLFEKTGALGVGVVIKAQHLCMKCRGVKNPTSYMQTSKLIGEFEKPEVRAEFLSMIK